jgi:streptogramin lyase
MWAVSGGDQPKLRVIDARSGKVLRIAPLDQYSGGAFEAGGRVLIGSGKSGKTPVFTLAGAGPTASIPVETPWLWSAGGKLYRIPSNGDLAELDPVTLAVVRTYHVPAHGDNDPDLVADDAGHLYYRADNTHIYRVDLASGNVDQFLLLPWEEAPTGMAFGFGSLWITNFDQDTVWRVNTAL